MTVLRFLCVHNLAPTSAGVCDPLRRVLLCVSHFLFFCTRALWQAARIIEALWEPQHHFVVHVDAKSESEATYAALADFAAAFANRTASGSNVHVLGDEYVGAQPTHAPTHAPLCKTHRHPFFHVRAATQDQPYFAA